MTFKEALALVESLMPAVIGGSMGIFALVGLRELFKEAKLAFKKSASA
ncbi:hypothetical protein [Prochlorococcus sp. MIT 1307]|nr:hypothetical protein [Prochlorococcus sp. MIT 1307]